MRLSLEWYLGFKVLFSLSILQRDMGGNVSKIRDKVKFGVTIRAN